MLHTQEVAFYFVTLTPCNGFECFIRKSIPLRTFILDKKSIIFIVHLSPEINYERLFETLYFYERTFV
ncbi:hypothetical protein FDZ14_00340 (plasmid) [Priestia megaterium]|uniref:Uncharacterized protein n=1 Tax=Priestia megaterium TaxID=1404 RepID=A0A6M6DQ23_PRIMG|nr:hypothetical protein FDZ14_00340 [Priestia megaterium]